MISEAADVATYIEELPPERQAPIRKLRSLCRRLLKGYQEGMEHGMPVYKRNGAVEVAYASQKQYIALYALKADIVDRFRSAFAGASIGKGCIRFRNPEKIDFTVVERLLSETAASKSAPC